uniref:Uncharacterized protein n=1 Tax=Triticum urartu TaxID=4572 RepID=A0A8R7QG59_TRIUA
MYMSVYFFLCHRHLILSFSLYVVQTHLYEPICRKSAYVLLSSYRERKLGGTHYQSCV